ncbi:MAG: hypothetical protein ACLPID_20655 [Beijerinckiaceae bacterium]
MREAHLDFFAQPRHALEGGRFIQFARTLAPGLEEIVPFVRRAFNALIGSLSCRREAGGQGPPRR